MLVAALRPHGVFERTLAVGQSVPGAFGCFCYRRLKSRYTRRSAPLFEQCVSGLSPGDIAIALGAHVGDVTERLAETGATVHAFEPNPAAFAALSARLGSRSNVVLHQKAASDHDGHAMLCQARSANPRGGHASKAS